MVNIKRGCISKFAYRVSMSSSGPIPAVDYFVVISFCVKVGHIHLLSHPSDIGTLGREQTAQKQVSTMKSKIKGCDQHFYINNTRRLLSQPDWCYWGGSGKEGSEDEAQK